MSIRAESLADAHSLDRFDCGDEGLNQWLQREAIPAEQRGVRTYVVVDDAREVVGYCAVAPHLVERDGRTRVPHRIPAVLLARLAVDRRSQGQGLGSELLVWVLSLLVAASRTAQAKVVVAGAIDDRAARFYEDHGFVPIAGNGRRLVQSIASIAETLGLSAG